MVASSNELVTFKYPVTSDNDEEVLQSLSKVQILSNSRLPLHEQQ